MFVPYCARAASGSVFPIVSIAIASKIRSTYLCGFNASFARPKSIYKVYVLLEGFIHRPSISGHLYKVGCLMPGRIDRHLGFLAVALALLLGALGVACSTAGAPSTSNSNAVPAPAPISPPPIQQPPPAAAPPVEVISTPASTTTPLAESTATSTTPPASTPVVVPTQVEAAPESETTASDANVTGEGESYASIFGQLNPDGPKEVDPRFYRQLLPRDAIRPIYQPEIIASQSAQLEEDDLVIGVTVGPQARAYPIRTLRFREMVNDELDGVPILVTW